MKEIRRGRGLAVAAAIAMIAFAGGRAGATVAKGQLRATGHAPGASGKIKVVLKKGGARGKFVVAGKKLPAGRTLAVVVNKVKVGTLTTAPNGRGAARFSTNPHGRDALMGFDPSGAAVEVREDSGDDDLEGTVPATGDPNAVACCLPGHEGEVECEDLTAAACTAHGGSVASATSCIPDPCSSAPPPGGEVVCCLTDSAAGAMVDDAPEVECEGKTQAECAAAHGTVVQAASCEPNPCAPVPPPQVVVCCVPGDGEIECDTLTPDHCTAHQGTPSTAASCDPDPCAGASPGGGDHGSGHGD